MFDAFEDLSDALEYLINLLKVNSLHLCSFEVELIVDLFDFGWKDPYFAQRDQRLMLFNDEEFIENGSNAGQRAIKLIKNNKFDKSSDSLI